MGSAILTCRWPAYLLSSFLLTGASAQAAQLPGVAATRPDEIVLFPFDDHTIPFTHGLRLQLESGQKRGVVLPLGGEGAPDSDMVEFYGSLIRIDGQFRMWYLGRNFGADDFEHGPFRVCYAVSDDGIHWKRPDLGLVEFLDSRQNNLVGLEQDDGNVTAIRAQSVLVLYEPDDGDPNRRFKMVIETEGPHPPWAGSVFFSSDGLRWQPFPRNPVITHMVEPSGLIRFNGVYYLNGHNINYWDIGRVLATYISYDFENWSEASNLGFRRLFPKTLVHTGDPKQQIHMGAALWNRGNVIIGFYGMWQYPEVGGNLKLHMPLGLIVSNDALHYREPVPDFEIIPAKGEEDGSWPALQQAQAFENIGDKTYVWYSCWDEYGWANRDPSNHGGLVRLATWDRDRLGYFYWHFAPSQTDQQAPGKSNPHFISRPILLDAGDAVFVNADRLSANAYLRVELLDERLRRLSGFSGLEAGVVKQSGLREPVSWHEGKAPAGFDKPVRIRVGYEGPEAQDIRVYALYAGRPLGD